MSAPLWGPELIGMSARRRIIIPPQILKNDAVPKAASLQCAAQPRRENEGNKNSSSLFVI